MLSLEHRRAKPDNLTSYRKAEILWKCRLSRPSRLPETYLCSMIPFSPPHLSERAIEEVVATLRSGWITTGPRTKLLEQKLADYVGAPKVLCLNSATAGLEIMLRWFGVGPGDEVIVPAYTYSATANVVEHCGATVVFADVREADFNIQVSCVEKLITERTKVIMPVDFAGWPCDYDALQALLERPDIRERFKPETAVQQQLGRILLLSDAAHSVGARYKGRRTGTLADATVFSFHAVKNLTTAEGGAVVLNLPAPFDNQAIYTYLAMATLHGQNKDALAKTQKGNWRYDILEPGYKCNMTDIMAAIGLVELERYESEIMPRRREIVKRYDAFFRTTAWAELPISEAGDSYSCFHLYPLRIYGISEAQRDEIIRRIFEQDVSVNVHFIPVPMMSFYRSKGYDIANYPMTYYNYSREISLPVFEDLHPELQNQVIQAVSNAVNSVLQQA